MSPIFLLRLTLDLVAAGLLLACLAYWWLGNLAHELMGAVLFLLLGVHAVFNRRWYGGLLRGRYDPSRRIGVAVNLSFLAIMLVLMLTSLAISRSVLAVFSLEDDIAIRDLHRLAAYWAVAVLGIHLGLNWPRIMSRVRGLLGLRPGSLPRTVFLRICSCAIALLGIRSAFEMAFGSKLVLHPTLDMWDFGEQTPRFFLNYLSIVGLYAAATHSALVLIRPAGRRRFRAGRGLARRAMTVPPDAREHAGDGSP